MNSYDKTRPLYLETDASCVGLGAGLLQIRGEMNCTQNVTPHSSILILNTFVNKILPCVETRHSNIEEEALGTHHGLENFHHYCFTRTVSSQITSHW